MVTTVAPDLTFVATCDLAAVVRGRAVPGRLDPASPPTVGWVPADLAIDSFGTLVEPNAFGSVGDLRLVADPAAAATLPDGDGSLTVALADQCLPDGTPWACCPRTYLRSAAARLEREFGLRAVASFEHEFHLAGGAAAPAFSLAALRDAGPIGRDVVGALHVAGFEPETWLAEFGSGQYEITVSPASALAAADRAVLLREIVRDAARRHGRQASFAPMVTAGGAGNGVHVHCSLVDATSGRPVMFDAGADAGLSHLGACFAHGIVSHAPALVGITAPSPVSSLRLGPHHWSSAGAFLAAGDREALVRLCPVDHSRPDRAAAQFNLEYRAADATGNPYLVLGALLHAGMSGLAGDVAASVRHSDVAAADDPGLEPLPASLAAALAALEADDVVAGSMDPLLLATFLDVRRSEAAAVAGLDEAAACRRFADVH